MPKYTYETTGNGLTIEIFKDGESIAFLQGDDAAQLLADIALVEGLELDYSKFTPWGSAEEHVGVLLDAYDC